jgi:hypothetical protein
MTQCVIIQVVTHCVINAKASSRAEMSQAGRNVNIGHVSVNGFRVQKEYDNE